jgi:hypothetical protein
VTESQLRKVVPGDLLWRGDEPLLVLELDEMKGPSRYPVPLVKALLPSGVVSWFPCDGVSPFPPPGV